MSNERVYGTVVHRGLRHEASGVIGGTFARKKGSWNTYTVCGAYIGVPVETNEDLVITCIRCLGKKRGTGDYRDILRGQTADYVVIDEAQDFEAFKYLDAKVTNPCAEIPLPTFLDESSVEVPADATCVAAGTPSTPLQPSPGRRRGKRRSR